MYCKYCKLSGHLIDHCPDIICKICKEYGHAHWKCIKKEKKSSVSKPQTKPMVGDSLNVKSLKDMVEYIDKPWNELS